MNSAWIIKSGKLYYKGYGKYSAKQKYAIRFYSLEEVEGTMVDGDRKVSLNRKFQKPSNNLWAVFDVKDKGIVRFMWAVDKEPGELPDSYIKLNYRLAK